jgi:cellulose synthase operon protein C
MLRLLGLLTILLAAPPAALPAERFKQEPSEAASNANASEINRLTDLGWSQYKAGQLSDSAAKFEEALQKNPPDALAGEICYARGKILEKLDQFDPALALYDRLIEKYPNSSQHPDALYSAARLRMKLHQYQQAAALCEKLTQDYPKYAKLDVVLYYWARTLTELNKPAEADKLYFRVQREFPKSRYWADATCRLARRAWEAQNASQANFLLDTLLAADSPPALREFALSLHAQIAISTKDWKKIRLAFERLVRDFPETNQRLLAEFWIAESQYRLKNIDEAERQFEALSKRALGQQDPWIAMIALRRAQIALSRKNFPQAHAIAAAIVKDFPDFDQQYEADFVIGRCLADRGDFEDARTAYKKVIRSPAGEKTETAAMAGWLIGETYFIEGNFDAALNEYLRVENRCEFPAWQALALLEAAKCHERLGDNARAVQNYQRILDRYSQTPSAKEAKRRVDLLNENQKEE